ncbi:TPA: hypothetical protein DCY68_03225 [Candidatus Azambacteria bacterium]|nr:hypothetical protein [Candidatus Azambacteria bacterium]HBA52782.1 hypothetical protein [Candidatus Azambacteria bacterium]HBC59386.1 hypothetical protein [Candidatus Azambacteria bacterium]
MNYTIITKFKRKGGMETTDETKNACHDRFEEGRGNSTGPEHMTETNQLVECLHCPDVAECWEDKEQIFNLLRQNQYSQE